MPLAFVYRSRHAFQVKCIILPMKRDKLLSKTLNYLDINRGRANKYSAEHIDDKWFKNCMLSETRFSLIIKKLCFRFVFVFQCSGSSCITLLRFTLRKRFVQRCTQKLYVMLNLISMLNWKYLVFGIFKYWTWRSVQKLYYNVLNYILFHDFRTNCENNICFVKLIFIHQYIHLQLWYNRYNAFLNYRYHVWRTISLCNIIMSSGIGVF